MQPNRTDQDESDYLTPAEASRATGLSVRQLARLADDGKLSSIRPGKHRRYSGASVSALVASEPWEPAS